MATKYKYVEDFTFEGKRYKVRASTDKELAVKKALKLKELQDGVKRESEICVKDYAQKWLETFEKPYVAQKTTEMYVTAINNINKYIGSKRMKSITSTEIQSIITSEYEKGRSKSHIDKIAMTLRRIFKQATVDRVIRNNPTLSIIKPQIEAGGNRAITAEERKAILEVAKTHRHGRWIRAMLFLGFRTSETSRILGKHIDLENKRLYIDGTKTKQARRWVPIPDIILDDFKGFEDDEYVFATKNGTPPNKQRLQQWWHAFKRDLDIYMGAEVYRNEVIKSVVAEDLVPYCLRHTYGTDCSSAKMPIEWLCKYMGHADISTTQKYYIDESLTSQNESRKIMNEFYSKKLNDTTTTQQL